MSHAILNALHEIVSLYASAFHAAAFFMLASLKDMIAPVIALSGLLAGLMVHPRTRRVTMAVIKYTNRHAPKWAKPAMVACAFFPGQADEIALVAILLIPILRVEFNRRVLTRTIRYHWKG